MSAEPSPPPPTAEAQSSGTSSTGSSEASSFRVYNPPRIDPATRHELPDDYFTPSAADLKAAQASLHARTQALSNAPFQTRAARELGVKAKHERWPKATIRVRFTDRTQLETTFASTDKIRSVYAFVRSSLREDVKTTKFILYQTPPKRDLKVSDPNVRDLSLLELQLAPSSILMLRFEDEALNGTEYPAPLAPSFLERAEDLPAPISYDAPRQQSPSESSSSSTANKPASTSGTTGGEKKVPKWLKLGKK
ncbi:hypothetical protein EWM64_g980 [Hericium alpestre]|uniref:UBX domain-containing protein n=1 Tax=Hericium alpestre TaxID=135208 RepID=A0A4Z0A9V2_9AGAM|nr:hypothetical protein EWM64_g980 [Hericium alpestre]